MKPSIPCSTESAGSGFVWSQSSSSFRKPTGKRIGTNVTPGVLPACYDIIPCSVSRCITVCNVTLIRNYGSH